MEIYTMNERERATYQEIIERPPKNDGRSNLRAETDLEWDDFSCDTRLDFRTGI